MTNVRMGEIAVSARAGCELVALGLGSCIGLAMIESRAGVAGLAHIVLPESRGDGEGVGKFADLAVPELLARVCALGAVTRRIEVVIAGGARMFALEGGLDVGARNEEAVRDALRRLGLVVHAAHTGGHEGRTLRVRVGSGPTTIRVAGAEPVVVLAGDSPAGGRRAALLSALAMKPGLVGGC